MPGLNEASVAELQRVVAAGGVALFPSDTVYGLACDPDSAAAVERVRALKGRPPERPSAVMFFSLAAAAPAVEPLGPRTRAAVERLLPAALTLLLPNPAGLFAPACAPDPERLGVRVPELTAPLSALAALRVPVAQTSANPSGGPDARSVTGVDPAIVAGVDLVIDGGELPGIASTVVDLTGYEQAGVFEIVRAGAVAEPSIEAALRD